MQYFIDSTMDFSDYKIIILPDVKITDDKTIEKIREYIKNGGKVIASGESIIKDGKFIWFMSEEEAAVKFDVGVSTIRAWYACKKLDGIKIGDQLYFLRNVSDPRKDDKHG